MPVRPGGRIHDVPNRYDAKHCKSRANGKVNLTANVSSLDDILDNASVSDCMKSHNHINVILSIDSSFNPGPCSRYTHCVLEPFIRVVKRISRDLVRGESNLRFRTLREPSRHK